MDAGYLNKKGFLALYKNTRYHIPKFQNVAPRGSNELFNSFHSSLQDIIERAFGVLKKIWSILQNTPPYTFSTQVKIVIVEMTIHNFIVEQRLQDKILDEAQQMNTLGNNNNENGGEE